MCRAAWEGGGGGGEGGGADMDPQAKEFRRRKTCKKGRQMHEMAKKNVNSVASKSLGP